MAQEHGEGDGAANPAANVIPLPSGLPESSESAADTETVHDKLEHLWHLLLDRLIEETKNPNAKASMLAVVRQFLWDNRRGLEHHQGHHTRPMPKPAGMAHVSAQLMALRDGGLVLPFAAPDDDDEEGEADF